MSDYYCPHCGADLGDQYGFDPDAGYWTCTECGQFLMDDDIADGDVYEGVAWFCDNCNALLNRQSGFSDSYSTWTCTECGHTNDLSEDDIIEDQHKCPCCGSNLKKQWSYSTYLNDYTCSECDAQLHRDYSSDEFSEVDDDEDNYSGFSSYDSNVYDDDEDDDEEDDDEEDDDEEDDDDEDDDEEDDDDDVDEEASQSYFDSEEYQRRMAAQEARRQEEARRRQEEEHRKEEERRRREEEHRIKAEKRKENRKKIWRTLTGKKQTAGISSDACRCMNYSDVVHILETQEFYNITTRIVEDLSAEEKAREGIVEKVSFNGTEAFDKDTQFPYSANIEVVYHMMKRQKPPISSREAKRKDVDDITWEFSHAGFVNIERIAISDLRKGWLVKEDSVEKVEINGKSDYRKKDKIRIDAAVVVYYHTFKNKNHQD